MYSSLARTVALTITRRSSSLPSLRPLVLTSSSIPCRRLSLASLGGAFKPPKLTNFPTTRKKHLLAPIADFNYPLPTLSTTYTDHLIRGTDFSTYITPLYHRNWGVRFRGLSGQDQSCLRKTFVFAPSPESVSEGSMELLRFLDEASKLNKSPKVSLPFALYLELLLEGRGSLIRLCHKSESKSPCYTIQSAVLCSPSPSLLALPST